MLRKPWRISSVEKSGVRTQKENEKLEEDQADAQGMILGDQLDVNNLSKTNNFWFIMLSLYWWVVSIYLSFLTV